ncbi:hypothetical protein CSKR_111075 [Clonorchis sinensis]|uniref:Ankyrin repeat domain-containing protein 49 n=2 Tax=Clonorchis sinensis TaxID=79923 RepID=G7YKG2_CLOSI|nr:hypothetical protein CSKR_111075 [Clonorchis sinensis]GAA53444.1 ankyrin repeat domain-containing protein 49 [Clonorchis sinensis]
MSSHSDEEADGLPFDMDEIMTAKRNNPGMFVSAWEADENDIEQWSKAQIRADPIKQFIVAAENGKLDTINEIVCRAEKTVSDPTPYPTLSELLAAKDQDGYTALHRAAYGGHAHVVERLLQLGGDVNSRTMDGWTPLHSAAFWNQLACVQLLLSAGADLNAVTNSNQTALHLAVSNNQSPETLYFLLSQPNASVYGIRNQLGDTVADLIERNTPYSDLCYVFSEHVTQLGRPPSKATG